ncbi:hypothetical protein [Oceanisphaera pacifica]|uniref:Uncharacterized protein n=1 Tax=Oceanisphaera pacifica TaxID=2818389 RepID=A0ABS3NCD5_9GAMM|nr:hypothetical protein [Oceanisphaera pacifica]MBO1518257.1 hypothetical protein [Oceanisphaera pacifica]
MFYIIIMAIANVILYTILNYFDVPLVITYGIIFIILITTIIAVLGRYLYQWLKRR